MEGKAEVFPKSGRSFDPAEIPKAIKNAGFSAPEVVATVKGALVKKNGHLELEVPGLKHPFLLAGGSQADALKLRSDLVGKVVGLTGKLLGAAAGHPPTLTIETFAASP